MRIALDYDDTYTAAPELWDRVIALIKEAGHQVWIVTARRDTEENREFVKVDGCYTVFTELRAKQTHCYERGLKIDIWIDDNPRTILEAY